MKRHRISIPYVTDQVLRNTSDAVDPNEVIDQQISDDITNPKQDLKEFLDTRELNYRTRASSASSYDDDDWADSIVDLSRKSQHKSDGEDNPQKSSGGPNLVLPSISSGVQDKCSPNTTKDNKIYKVDREDNDMGPNIHQIPENRPVYPSQMYPLLEVPGNYNLLIPKLQFFFKYYGLYEDTDYVVDKDNQGYYFYPTKKWTTRDQKEMFECTPKKEENEDDALLNLEDINDDGPFDEDPEVHQLIDFITKGFYVEKRNIKGTYYFDINNPSLNVNKIANVDCQNKVLSVKEKIDMIFKASGIYRAMKLKAKW
ncbi:phosphoprotein [Beatrice Hill virus]|uniref:Phosphoprotein n=1 Tax=Beatrice Hill virus TaxID=1819301 RepID=A0A1J0F5D7_9RHAB|nr:phosphoprotein [Beatrice Hill virus]APC23639.1 phosphoprotein [Beatrice Hill virus]